MLKNNNLDLKKMQQRFNTQKKKKKEIIQFLSIISKTTKYIVKKNKIDEKTNEMNKKYLFVSTKYIKHNLHFV